MIESRSSDAYLHKDSILCKISEYDIFRYYCHNFKNYGDKFCSELREDRSPTCSIVPWKGKVIYKDFGSGDSHDCFSYVQAKYGLTFSEAMRVIDTDFGLGLQSGTVIKSQIAITYGTQDVIERRPTKIEKKARQWNVEDKNFWSQFHIPKHLLTKFGVQPIDYFWINEARYRCHSLSYVYNINGRYKVYRPFETEGKWYSNTSKDDIQGWRQLKDNGDIVILASSLKDVMCLNVLGYEAIALQSEMQMPSADLIKQLSKRFTIVAVLYDNDFEKDANPGQTMANKICAEFNLINIILPAHYKSKDISDLMRDHGVEVAEKIVKIQLP
mgnify:FL=1